MKKDLEEVGYTVALADIASLNNPTSKNRFVLTTRIGKKQRIL
jgi:hypothetical protein